MRWLAFFITLFIATLLEAGHLLNWMAISGWSVRPSILVTLLVYFAVTSRSAEAISFSFLIGLAADLSGGLLGPHMLLYGLAGVMLHAVSHSLTLRRATQKALFVFLIFMVTETGAYWLSVLKTGENRPHIFPVLLLTGLYSAIISPLVWSIVSSLTGWSRTKHGKTHRVYH